MELTGYSVAAVPARAIGIHSYMYISLLLATLRLYITAAATFGA